MSSAFLFTFPFESVRVILGFSSVFFDWALQSITDFDEMPVVYRIDCQLMIESYFFLKIVKNTYLEYTLNKAAQMKI